MSAEPAVRFENVSKRFSRSKRVKTLADWVINLPRRLAARRGADDLLPHEFWALRDVSFSVRPGEMLGIIGPNGAGKSTVLKLLYRILRPDGGHVRVRGRVGGLIELGAGFHPYLSGRENVSINGAILGMSRKQVRERYGAIVDFAGLAEFMEMPVKDYSSGMYARLAFSIAAHAAPEVLLVDEVLGVGDAGFQLKCYDWMSRMRQKGCAVISVSHEMGVMGGCTACVFLDKGQAVREGPPRQVIEHYLSTLQARGAGISHEVMSVPGADGRPRVEITRLEFFDSDGRPAQAVAPGADITARMEYVAHEPIESPIFSITLHHDDLRIPFNLPRHWLFQAYSGPAFAGQVLHGRGNVEVRIRGLRMPVGAYRAHAVLNERDAATPIYSRDGAARIEMLRGADSDGRGLIDHQQQWKLLGSEAANQ